MSPPLSKAWRFPIVVCVDVLRAYGRNDAISQMEGMIMAGRSVIR
jgi:hypothetical protein